MSDIPLLRDLNEKQKLAVEAPRSPLLILAGPGTGKTRTLITRIIYEIEIYKILPDQILALTFSNKAANEIKQRLFETIPAKADKIRCCTFHSFCLDVLRKYHEQAGLNKYFSVCDEDYRYRLLSNLLKTRTRDNPKKKINGVLLAFSNFMLKGKPLPAFSATVYDDYIEHLKKHHLIDFDQILIKTLNLFKNHKDILDQYRFLNQSVLVDEFQDTDPVQYEIVRLLAEKHGNIFVVADEDQSIYAWRGANPENIRRFIKDFVIDAPIFLEKNYRCGKNIMDTAFELIKNTDRVEPDKTIMGNPDEKAALKAVFFRNERQEIDFIIQKIKDWQSKEHIPNSAIAVIYPRHTFGETLSAFLLKERIPFQQAEGRNLSEHPTMKKIMLYLKLIRDPADNLILEELVEAELGYHILKQIQNIAENDRIAFRKALNALAGRQEISYQLRNQLNTFIGNIANLINLKSFFNFEQLVGEIVRSLQTLKPSVLHRNLSKLKDVSFKYFPKAQKKFSKIWIFHSDDKICFLSRRLIEKALKISTVCLNRERLIHVDQKDLVLLMEPLKVENLPCPYVNLFQEKQARRQGMMSVLFRWLQIQLQSGKTVFDDYVVFDLETTGKDPKSCAIVEIAAVRVKEGKIVAEFQKLINPEKAIEKEAMAVHHIAEEDVKDQPRIAEVWDDFKSFIGNNLLVAHNGFSFDFKIMDRISREYGLSRLTNLRYDSLILARNLFTGQQNSIDALAERFKLDAGTRHRALDDVKVLHYIFQKLLSIQKNNEIKSGAEEYCEFVSLGNVLENALAPAEDRILFNAGIKKLLSPYSQIRQDYCKEFSVNDDELQQNLLSISLKNVLSSDTYNSEEEFFHKILNTAREFSLAPVDLAIPEFLSFVSLVNHQDSLEKIDAVSLLTFHAAKGLEFDKVIILGMEDEQMPSFFAYRSDDQDDRPVSKKLEEQKRLLYVGITRGKSEVIFTIVQNRNGRRQKSSPFLDDIRANIQVQTLS